VENIRINLLPAKIYSEIEIHGIWKNDRLCVSNEFHGKIKNRSFADIAARHNRDTGILWLKKFKGEIQTSIYQVPVANGVGICAQRALASTKWIFLQNQEKDRVIRIKRLFSAKTPRRSSVFFQKVQTNPMEIRHDLLLEWILRRQLYWAYSRGHGFDYLESESRSFDK